MRSTKMLTSKANDKPSLGGHPRIALDITIELLAETMLSTLVLDENFPLLVTQVRVGNDSTDGVPDLILRSHRWKVAAGQPVPNHALRGGLRSCVQAGKAVPALTYPPAPGGRHDALIKGLSVGQAQTKDRVPDGDQFRNSQVLGKIDVKASAGCDPDSGHFVDVSRDKHAPMDDQLRALRKDSARR